MAYIGMRSPVAAAVSAHTDGSAITYGTGFVIGPAVAANLNLDIADNPDYGDDIIIDNDTGCNGYSGTLETNYISADVRASLLGWEPVGTTVTHYEVTDGSAPVVGWGFIRVTMFKATRSYEAFWFHKAQFTPTSINGNTKQQQIAWNHPQLNVKGLGAYIDDSGKAKYFDWMSFESEAAAKTWLYTKANISTTTT